MLLPRLLLASGLSRSCVRVTLSRLDTLGEAADNAGEPKRRIGWIKETKNDPGQSDGKVKVVGGHLGDCFG